VEGRIPREFLRKVQADVEAALAVRPDDGEAIRARGYLRTAEKKYPEATSRA